MTEETAQYDTRGASAEPADPAPRSAWDWTRRLWRPAGTAVVIGLALLLGWHVVNGKHGLSSWEQKRAEDVELQKEIQDLQQENVRLRLRVERLKSDPDAIEHEAREKLRYAKPGEVIVDLSGETNGGQSAPASPQNR